MNAQVALMATGPTTGPKRADRFVSELAAAIASLPPKLMMTVEAGLENSPMPDPTRKSRIARSTSEVFQETVKESIKAPKVTSPAPTKTKGPGLYLSVR